jgi:hypothetical protein
LFVWCEGCAVSTTKATIPTSKNEPWCSKAALRSSRRGGVEQYSPQMFMANCLNVRSACILPLEPMSTPGLQSSSPPQEQKAPDRLVPNVTVGTACILRLRQPCQRLADSHPALQRRTRIGLVDRCLHTKEHLAAFAQLVEHCSKLVIGQPSAPSYRSNCRQHPLTTSALNACLAER